MVDKGRTIKMELNTIYIGAEICGLRTKNNISQQELAAKTQISLPRLKQIEKGFKMPKLKDVCNICIFFSISIEDFLKFNNISIAI
jgi:transcriptional regulator with XRE-family HTH domain